MGVGFILEITTLNMCCFQFGGGSFIGSHCVALAGVEQADVKLLNTGIKSMTHHA